ncbi:MAG: O-antigen ligase family protein [Candidatus Promineifilaceae bacterium]
MPTAVFAFFGRITSPEIYPLLAQPTLYLSDLAIVWLLVVYGSRPKPMVETVSLADLLWLALCVAGCLTTLTAQAPLFAVYTVLRWIIAFVVYRFLLHAPIRVQHLVSVFVVGLSVQAGIGIVQSMTQQRVGIPGESLFLYFDRATGMTFHPNVLAGYLVVGLILTLPLLQRMRWWIVWWLLWVGVYVTGSRSAIMSVLLGMPLAVGWLLWYRPNLRRNLLIALVGAGIAIGATNTLLGTNAHRVEATFNVLIELDPSLSTDDERSWLAQAPDWAKKVPGGWWRWQLFEVAFGIIVARPLNGIGAGNFPLATVDVYAALDYPYPDNVHNVPLLLASEVGVWGGGVWLGLALLGGWWLMFYWRADNIWLIVGLCAWLALVGESMFEYYVWGLETGRLLTMFVWAIIGRNLTA